ncbi:MAG: hypothetical protein GX943_00525 [Candidatus Pacebacteria bacterium]|nr:hypothetical protein [Candidatus Paceibacterota bacterium]
MSDNTISSTTQEFLDVYDITNDMVILKDGVVSIIMQIGTMNFNLLAEQEQDAIMYTYGALLNSLNFPIQINIQSNIKDASRYLRLLDNQIKQSKSRAKSQLIGEYRDFVANLIRERNVLEKKFFVVIPTNAGEMGLYTAESVLPGKTKFDINNFEKTVLIEKAATILDPRRDHLISQFNRIGLFARQLDTQEIIQNFYINYNPESMEGQEVTNSESYTTPLVTASLTSEQSFKQAQQDSQQIDDSNLIQNKNQPTVLENKQDAQDVQDVQDVQNAQKFQELPKTQETDDVPSFSEEIASLQSSATNENPTFSQQDKDLGLKPSQVPSPTQLNMADNQTPALKIEVPPPPTIGLSETQTNTQTETTETKQDQTLIKNKANIAEL